jgi:hypothetical protein
LLATITSTSSFIVRSLFVLVPSLFVRCLFVRQLFGVVRSRCSFVRVVRSFVVRLLFVCCSIVVPLLFVCCSFVVCLLFVHRSFVVCLLFVRRLFVVCSFVVRRLSFVIHLLFARRSFVCRSSFVVRRSFVVCSSLAHSSFVVCLLLGLLGRALTHSPPGILHPSLSMLIVAYLHARSSAPPHAPAPWLSITY